MNSASPDRFRTRYVQRPPLRARMQAGETLVGSFVFLPNPSVIEILAEAGLEEGAFSENPGSRCPAAPAGPAAASGP